MGDTVLRCWPDYFAAVIDGSKPFEVRRADDRSFAVGDTIGLREWDPATEDYTGREAFVTVTYVLRPDQHPGVAEGHVVLGIRADPAPPSDPAAPLDGGLPWCRTSPRVYTYKTARRADWCFEHQRPMAECRDEARAALATPAPKEADRE